MRALSLDAIVDLLCQQGCQQVARTIDSIESGQFPDIILALNAHERQHVLHELKAVMAVYGDRSCAIRSHGNSDLDNN